MITHQPYSVSLLQSLLEEIGSLVPGAIGIRNDPLVSSRFTHPAVVHTTYVEMESGKIIQVRLPPVIDELARKLVRDVVAEKFGLGQLEADRFIDASHALQKLNSIGAWPLRTSEREPMVANSVEVGVLAYEQGDYLSESIAFLEDTLEKIDSIVIRYCDLSARGPRWRAWASFTSDSDKLEFASIDTSAIALHLEAKLTRRQSRMREINIVRMQGWADQLACRQVEMPKILHFLSLYVANLGLTRVDLD